MCNCPLCHDVTTCPICMEWREHIEEVKKLECTCEVPWLPIGGEVCERCGGTVKGKREAR